MQPALDRTPSRHRSGAGVWCFEREFEGKEGTPPVRLVVFDCDETLTVGTFCSPDKSLRTVIGHRPEQAALMTEYSFEPLPFSSGDRRESRQGKLQRMLQSLQHGQEANGPRRVLAVLTRNQLGSIAALNVLMMAGVAEYFSAVWSMARSKGSERQGVYKDGEEWKLFDPPFASIPDFKADVLADIARQPSSWFPQLATARGDFSDILAYPLKMEEILLVDDVRTNFQSETAKVLRCCKVARYDITYRDMGYIQNMGGIGARDDRDYKKLVAFADNPSASPAGSCQRLSCVEKYFEGCDSDPEPPVKLIVFDFDETLTLYTFVPEEVEFASEIGYLGRSQKFREKYVQYNFDSPHLPGRLPKLRALLRDLENASGERRTLVVLTRNEFGAVAVLNLLRWANLANCFSGVWALCADSGKPTGVWKDVDEWKVFDLPLERSTACKADVLHSISSIPTQWFPQIDGEETVHSLLNVQLENIVLVDDDPCSFSAEPEGRTPPSGGCAQSSKSSMAVRYCQVQRYDDVYRDQGLLLHMGGLGAKHEDDFTSLRDFVAHPRCCRSDQEEGEPPCTGSFTLSKDEPDSDGILSRCLTRSFSEDDPGLPTPGRRKVSCVDLSRTITPEDPL